MWKVGCGPLNLEPDLLPGPLGILAESERNLGWVGGPDLGWGVGPLYYRELGSSLNSVHNGGQGDLGVTLGGGTENSARASPPPLAPVLTDIPGPGTTPAEVFIASGFGGSSGPFSGEAGPGGGLWGSGSRRPWGVQLLPWPPAGSIPACANGGPLAP